MPRPLIIINNVAAKARIAWPFVRAELEASGIAFDSYETLAAGDATNKTRSALEAGSNLIVVVGGDGTLSEVAQGFFKFTNSQALPVAINSQARLAIIPAGTGDDFARGLTGRRAPIDYWVDILLSHLNEPDAVGTRIIDVLYGASDSYRHSFICLNASTLGIGGETASRVASQGKLIRRLSGETRFVLAAAGALVAWRERRVRITVDGHEFVDGPMNLVAVSNGIYAGAGMMFSPAALLDDGKLDVVSVSGLSRVALVREITRIHSGGHVANQKVKVRQGMGVRIETFDFEDGLLIEADGNLRGRTPVEFRVLPKALQIVSRYVRAADYAF